MEMKEPLQVSAISIIKQSNQHLSNTKSMRIDAIIVYHQNCMFSIPVNHRASSQILSLIQERSLLHKEIQSAIKWPYKQPSSPLSPLKGEVHSTNSVYLVNMDDSLQQSQLDGSNVSQSSKSNKFSSRQFNQCSLEKPLEKKLLKDSYIDDVILHQGLLQQGNDGYRFQTLKQLFSTNTNMVQEQRNIIKNEEQIKQQISFFIEFYGEDKYQQGSQQESRIALPKESKSKPQQSSSSQILQNTIRKISLYNEEEELYLTIHPKRQQISHQRLSQEQSFSLEEDFNVEQRKNEFSEQLLKLLQQYDQIQSSNLKNLAIKASQQQKEEDFGVQFIPKMHLVSYLEFQQLYNNLKDIQSKKSFQLLPQKQKFILIDQTINTVAALYHIGKDYLSRDSYKQALQHYQNSLLFINICHDKKFIKIKFQVQTAIAEAYIIMGLYSQAKAKYQQIIEDKTKIYGPSTPQVADTYLLLSKLHFQLEKFEQGILNHQNIRYYNNIAERINDFFSNIKQLITRADQITREILLKVIYSIQDNLMGYYQDTIVFQLKKQLKQMQIKETDLQQQAQNRVNSMQFRLQQLINDS